MYPLTLLALDPNPISIGTTGIVLSVTFLLLTLFSRHRIFPHPPTKPFLLTLTLISLIFATIAVTMAAFATAGLNQTCREFESLNGVPCGEIFENGFFEEVEEGGERIVYEKSLAWVKAAVAGGWIMGFAWLFGGVIKGWEWKNGKVRWW